MAEQRRGEYLKKTANSQEKEPIFDGDPFILGRDSSPESLKKDKEDEKSRPEIISLRPREDVALICSVPVWGEWDNGQLLRMIENFFAQRFTKGVSCEVHILLNGLGDFRRKQNKQSRVFLEKIILMPSLGKVEQEELIASGTSALERGILQKCARNDAVRFLLADTAKMLFEASSYKGHCIDSVRTMLADIAVARFPQKKDIPIALFDADTVLERNKTAQELVEIFQKNPDIFYCINGMATQVRGESRVFLDQIGADRTQYNTGEFNGSPQIVMRISAYEQLSEIARFFTSGYEDTDTAIRLLHRFGDTQEGILAQQGFYTPTVLTADRLGGFCDGKEPRHEWRGIALKLFLQKIHFFQIKILTSMALLSSVDKERAEEYLKKAREKYFVAQCVQQRMNRFVVRAFIDAVELGEIFLKEGEVSFDQDKLARKKFGKALLHYVSMNISLIREVLEDSEDIRVIAYICGKEEVPPSSEYRYSHFQNAVREYCGKPISFTEAFGRMTGENMPHHGEDVSFLHGGIAEMLALFAVYKQFLEVEKFSIKKQIKGDSYYNKGPRDYHFGSLHSRVQHLRELMDDVMEMPLPASAVNEESRNAQVPDQRSPLSLILEILSIFPFGSLLRDVLKKSKILS